MPGQVRKPDIDSMGHPNQTSSNNVYANCMQVARQTDIRMCGMMVGIDMGIHNVYSNSLSNQVIGDSVSSGHTQVLGSMNVFVN